MILHKLKFLNNIEKKKKNIRKMHKASQVIQQSIKTKASMPTRHMSYHVFFHKSHYYNEKKNDEKKNDEKKITNNRIKPNKIDKNINSNTNLTDTNINDTKNNYNIPPINDTNNNNPLNTNFNAKIIKKISKQTKKILEELGGHPMVIITPVTGNFK